jgi:hypothetical protein
MESSDTGIPVCGTNMDGGRFSRRGGQVHPTEEGLLLDGFQVVNPIWPRHVRYANHPLRKAVQLQQKWKRAPTTLFPHPDVEDTTAVKPVILQIRPSVLSHHAHPISHSSRVAALVVLPLAYPAPRMTLKTYMRLSGC